MSAGKWHVNDKGEPGQCGADEGKCPFGGEHFETKEEARSGYEASMESCVLSPVERSSSSLPTLKEMSLHHKEVLESAVEGKREIKGLDLSERQFYIEKVIAKLEKYGKTTEDLYSRQSDLSTERIYTAERVQKQREVIDEFLKNSENVKYEGKAIFAGGLGGAGKSTVIRENLKNFDRSEYITLNPDDIKEIMAEKGMIPRVKGLTPMESSPLAHEEASHITAMILSRMSRKRANIIFDITMSSTSSVKSRMDILKRNNYSKVEALFVDISIETSQKRISHRYRESMKNYTVKGEGNGGRTIPQRAIDSNRPTKRGFNSKNAENLVAIHEAGLFTSEPLIFTNEGLGPEQMEYSEFAGDTDFLFED